MESESRTGFHLITFETRFGEVPLFTSSEFDRGAKASIIIGPNGSGKSQVLAAVCNELTNIHQIIHRQTRSDTEPKLSRRLRMLDFEDEFPALSTSNFNEEVGTVTFDAKIVYRLGYDIWDIRRDSRTLKIFRNGQPSDVYSLVFPNRVLAIAHLPLDKFRFAKRSDSNFYRYLGLRQNTNMTSTGALATNTLLSFLETLDMPAGARFLERWLPILGLDQPIFASIEIKTNALLHASTREMFQNLGLGNLQKKVGSARAQAVNEDEALVAEFDKFWSFFEDLREQLLDIYPSGRRARHFLFEIGERDSTVAKSFTELAEFLRLGRKLRVLGQLKLCFSKSAQIVPFDDLSSGEQHVLSTLTQLIANLGESTVVLIDEPEISLHPDWQRQYIPMLLECLSTNPDTHTIIATHSHFLVSDIHEASGSLTVASRSKGTGFETYDSDVYGRSADNILYRVFGIGSSGNRFVEHDLALALSMISGTAEVDLVRLTEIRDRLLPLAADDNPALLRILESITSYLGTSNDA